MKAYRDCLYLTIERKRSPLSRQSSGDLLTADPSTTSVESAFRLADDKTANGSSSNNHTMSTSNNAQLGYDIPIPPDLMMDDVLPQGRSVEHTNKSWGSDRRRGHQSDVYLAQSMDRWV